MCICFANHNLNKSIQIIGSNILAKANSSRYRQNGAILNWLISPGKNMAGTIYCGLFFYIKIKDTLRIHAFWQFYGYKTNITAFFEIRKYRLVGGIKGFRSVKHLFENCSSEK